MIGFLIARFARMGVPQRFQRLAAVCVGLALLALLIGAVIRIADNAVEDFRDTAKDAGAAEAVKAGTDTTLKQVEKAHEAGNDVRNDAGYARFCECLFSASDATAGNCQRYLKDKPVSDRPADLRAYCPGCGGD